MDSINKFLFFKRSVDYTEDSLSSQQDFKRNGGQADGFIRFYMQCREDINMSKMINKKITKCVIFINRLADSEALDEKVYNGIEAGMFRRFLPITVKHEKNETVVECRAEGLTTLEDYFSSPVTRMMFLDVVRQLAAVISECESSSISLNNLDLEKDRIFLDPVTGNIRCVYWPVVNSQLSTLPYLFLQKLPWHISFTPDEDKAYLKQYAEFFERNQSFSTDDFTKLILELQGGQSPEPAFSTQAVSAENDEGKSCNGTAAQDQPVIPKLVRVKTGMEYSVNKSRFRIGTSAAHCDLSIADNYFIARIHAEIIARNHKYFIRDLRPVNRTYADGKLLPTGGEAELQDGSVIRLADEDFIFVLR